MPPVPPGLNPSYPLTPFGLFGNPSNPDIESQKFTGKERDAESGLDFFQARYMSSAQGRFTNKSACMLSFGYYHVNRLPSAQETGGSSEWNQSDSYDHSGRDPPRETCEMYPMAPA